MRRARVRLGRQRVAQERRVWWCRRRRLVVTIQGRHLKMGTAISMAHWLGRDVPAEEEEEEEQRVPEARRRPRSAAADRCRPWRRSSCGRG